MDQYYISDYKEYEILNLESVTITTITALRVATPSGNNFEFIKQ